jgi:hypothetical protein
MSKAMKILNIAALVGNLVGIFFYLKNASLSWAIPEEAGLSPATTGVAMVWGLGALPILLVFLCFDGIWWWRVTSQRSEKWPVILALMLWVGAVVVDFAHH